MRRLNHFSIVNVCFTITLCCSFVQNGHSEQNYICILIIIPSIFSMKEYFAKDICSVQTCSKENRKTQKTPQTSMDFLYYREFCPGRAWEGFAHLHSDISKRQKESSWKSQSLENCSIFLAESGGLSLLLLVLKRLGQIQRGWSRLRHQEFIAQVIQ